MSGRRIVRFSLDLESEQRNFVRLFALKNGINASVVMRALLFRLETDPLFASQIIDLIFSVPEEEVSEEEFEEAPSQDSPETSATVESHLKISDIKPGDYVYDSQGRKVILE